MKHFTATEAKNRFGELMEQAGNEPVAIQKNGRNYRVVLAAEDYERLAKQNAVRPLVKELHKRSMERRREVYEALAK
ncbi:MAG: type II toxin-antitoxin system prevent-host-death family antitoxin [Nitratireductor sp.]|nr:type II toxin-antitoxin system prevent-host-death family antitoxin [Nitratireductor sp.]